MKTFFAILMLAFAALLSTANAGEVKIKANFASVEAAHEISWSVQCLGHGCEGANVVLPKTKFFNRNMPKGRWLVKFSTKPTGQFNNTFKPCSWEKEFTTCDTETTCAQEYDFVCR